MATLPHPTATAGHGVLSSGTTLPLDRRACAPEGASARRRGRLRNGATPGDFLAAARCGARTRCGGACRQPAMKNGRCRLHGGLSTGPRTPEGRARCAAARTIHGGYNAETRALQAEAHAALKRFRALLAQTRPTAGHGVLRQNPVGAAPRGRPLADAAGRPHGAAPTTAPTAGHGVLSFKPSLVQRALLGSTALGISIRPPVSAGQGVLSLAAAGAAG